MVTVTRVIMKDREYGINGVFNPWHISQIQPNRLSAGPQVNNRTKQSWILFCLSSVS